MFANMLSSWMLLLLAVNSVFCLVYQPVEDDYQVLPIDKYSYKLKIKHMADGSMFEQLVQKLAPGKYIINGNIQFKPEPSLRLSLGR